MAEETKKRTTRTADKKGGTKSKTKSNYKSKPKTDSDGNEIPKKTVAEIAVERLIAKITETNLLPWQKPFRSACINWLTEKEYTGINPYLLSGGSGEFITEKQLEGYNEKNKTTFQVNKKFTYIIVVFKPREINLTHEQVDELNKKGLGWMIRQRPDGSFYRVKFTLRYYRVYDIRDIEPDKEGNTLQPKLGVTLHVRHTDADKIMDGYLEYEKIRIVKGQGAAYIPAMDVLESPPPEYYATSETYYRTIFHEMIHSTGHKKRLNRETLYTYHKSRKERSREELVAEVGAQLLSSEAGFTEDNNEWYNNSMEYIHGWCSWMKNNPEEVLKGVSQAERAMNFILDRIDTNKDILSTEDDSTQIHEEELEFA